MDDFNSSLFSPFFSASSRTDVSDSPKTRNLLPGKKRTKDLSAVAEQKSPTRVSQFDYLPGLIDSSTLISSTFRRRNYRDKTYDFA
nr:hypothetical protein Iba_chr07eCG5850 [Ipomoea batatas]